MIHSPKEAVLKETPSTPGIIDEKEADRKWKEAFANTTENELDCLEQMFVEEEAKNGTMPLDFKKR